MFVPLFLPVLWWYRHRLMPVKKTMVACLAAGLILCSLPMAVNMASPAVTKRLEVCITYKPFMESLGRKGTWQDVAEVAVSQYLSHFGWKYLFIRGDDDIRYSTHHTGKFSWFDMLGILAGIALFVGWVLQRRRKIPGAPGEERFVLFCVAGYLIGIWPSAFTYEGIPHGLRSIASWPFLMMLVGYWWDRAVARFPRTGLVLGLAAAITFSVYFMTTYFTLYQKESLGMYSPWTRDMAARAFAPGASPEDWFRFRYAFRHADYDYRYYAMLLKGDSCEKTRRDWMDFGELMRKLGKD
jgi:hypothetical protein